MSLSVLAIAGLLLCALMSVAVSAQTPTANRPPLVITKSTVTLVDQFGANAITSEERSARFDAFFQEISQARGSIGYVLLYCGKTCRYGEMEAHQRGIEIKMALRQFDRMRVVVLNAGFRENSELELWLSLDEKLAPRPRSTVNIRFVKFTKSTGRTFESYECCDDYSDIWKNLKP